MSAKLKSEYIKKKIKATYGDIEIRTPEFDKKVYENLAKIIRDVSVPVAKDGISDIQINNTTKIFREALISLTNIEDEQYWRQINDSELENMINLADGDFKEAVNCLLDIILGIAHDNRISEIRKITILINKLNEMKEAVKANIEVEKTLEIFGLDKEKLAKIEQGDESAMKELQNNMINMIKQEKPKRKYNKKK